MTGTVALLDPFFAAVEGLGEVDALGVIEACRRRCQAAELVVLAARVDVVSGDTRAAKRLLGAVDGLSNAEKQRRLNRAKAVADRPDLVNRVDRGEVSSEVLDLVVDADRKSDGAALADAGLVEDLVAAGPDLGRKVKDNWLNDRTTAADVEAKYRRQRQQRSAWRHQTAAGLAAITVAGDDVTIDRLWGEIKTGANRAYQADGGRDVPSHKHQRAYDQRLFDAAAELLAGVGNTGGAKRPGGAKLAGVFTIDIETLLGRVGRPIGNWVGTGPVADDVIIEALKDADLYTLVQSPTGRPLWCGRSRRKPSLAQLVALIVRDQGCIASGEHWQNAHAHHIVAWESPARGPTDIDMLALLSPAAHQDTHAKNIKWVFDESLRKWRKELAPPSERAPRLGPAP